MSDTDDAKLEALLADVPLKGPSPRLDWRMERLLQPAWRRFIGPLSGFAAGVLVTFSVMHALAGSPELPVGPIAPPSPIQAISTPSPRILSVLATPRHAIDEIDGTIDGIPVRLERRRTQLDLRPASASGQPWRTVDLPDVVTVRPIQPN